MLLMLARGVSTCRATEANDAGVQERTARMAVVALSWVSAGLFLVSRTELQNFSGAGSGMHLIMCSSYMPEVLHSRHWPSPAGSVS